MGTHQVFAAPPLNIKGIIFITQHREKTDGGSALNWNMKHYSSHYVPPSNPTLFFSTAMYGPYVCPRAGVWVTSGRWRWSGASCALWMDVSPTLQLQPEGTLNTLPLHLFSFFNLALAVPQNTTVFYHLQRHEDGKCIMPRRSRVQLSAKDPAISLGIFSLVHCLSIKRGWKYIITGLLQPCKYCRTCWGGVILVLINGRLEWWRVWLYVWRKETDDEEWKK